VARPLDEPLEEEAVIAIRVVTRDEREQLLKRFPPKYEKVIADHVTLRTGATPETPLPRKPEARIVGRADDGASLECLVVELDGTTERRDGSVYHVTWWLGPGRKARESNDVLRDQGWGHLPAPIDVSLEPARF
jgi:hypothetical protein